MVNGRVIITISNIVPGKVPSVAVEWESERKGKQEPRLTFEENGTVNTRAAINCIVGRLEMDERLARLVLLVMRRFDRPSPSLSVSKLLLDRGGNSIGRT